MASNKQSAAAATMNSQQQQQQQQQNRYAHLVASSGTSSNKVQTFALADKQQQQQSEQQQQQKRPQQSNYQQHNHNHHQTKAPPLKEAVAFTIGANGGNGANVNGSGQKQQQQQQQKNYYYQSFSSVDWRDQWTMLKTKTLEKVEEPKCQRKLIMLIVCTALLLDNMLYMVIVPIIPDYLRSIGSWSTYTENARWIRRNGSHGHAKWEQVGGQVVYEGEDSAVGFLFASKAIVQLIANPFSGAIADRIGYEIPMMFGLIVMFLSTMVFACGQTYSILFLARSLQGVGSAFADTPGIAMLADRFTEETERRRAQGIAIAFISFGCLVAPPFGSVLYQGAGKEVPFILLSLVCLIDGSLLLLVCPPGTFSQIWPKYYNSTGSSATSGSGSSFGASNSVNSSKQLQQQQQQQSIQPEAARAIQEAPSTVSPLALESGIDSNRKQQQQQVVATGTVGGGGGGGGGGGVPEDKRHAFQRQKSISRRHSMTVSAGGEAPKGTPIEVLLKDPCIACCAGALVVANVSLAFLEPTISIWVKNTMPDTEEWQEGMIWLPAFFPHVLGVFATLHFAEKYPQATWKIAASGLVIEGLGCLVVPFCTSFWSLIIPISIICFGVALIDTAILPTLGYLVDTRFTSVYGNVYAIADISYSVSYAIGPIIAGGIVEAIGFTALNILIAVVTFGYVPSLMMLRSIREYQPFEADQTGRLAERAKPFGKFGRSPIEEEEEEEEEEDDDANESPVLSLNDGDNGTASDDSSGLGAAPRPAAPTGPPNQQGPAWTGSSGSSSSFKKKTTTSDGQVRSPKSVKIIESHQQHMSDRAAAAATATASETSQLSRKSNPFE